MRTSKLQPSHVPPSLVSFLHSSYSLFSLQHPEGTLPKPWRETGDLLRSLLSLSFHTKVPKGICPAISLLLPLHTTPLTQECWLRAAWLPLYAPGSVLPRYPCSNCSSHHIDLSCLLWSAYFSVEPISRVLCNITSHLDLRTHGVLACCF